MRPITIAAAVLLASLFVSASFADVAQKDTLTQKPVAHEAAPDGCHQHGCFLHRLKAKIAAKHHAKHARRRARYRYYRHW